MKFVDRLLGRHDATQDLKEQYGVMSLDELTDLGFDINSLLPGQSNYPAPNKSGTIDDPYEEGFEPQVGWDKWCSWAADQGKIAHNVEILAKNAMSFEWVAESEEERTYWKLVSRRLHLHMQMILFYEDWLTFGRTFIQPVYDRPYGARQREIKKLQRMDPSKIKVIWDDYATATDFNSWVKNTRWRKYAHNIEKIGRAHV